VGKTVAKVIGKGSHVTSGLLFQIAEVG